GGEGLVTLHAQQQGTGFVLYRVRFSPLAERDDTAIAARPVGRLVPARADALRAGARRTPRQPALAAVRGARRALRTVHPRCADAMNAFSAPFRSMLAWCRRHRTLLLFGISLLFGALSVFGARGYIAEHLEVEKARLMPKRAMVEVVVARRDLERGALVAPENMAVREVPADFLPGSAVRPDRF